MEREKEVEEEAEEEEEREKKNEVVVFKHTTMNTVCKSANQY